jgi:hypothetical protein
MHNPMLVLSIILDPELTTRIFVTPPCIQSRSADLIRKRLFWFRDVTGIVPSGCVINNRDPYTKSTVHYLMLMAFLLMELCLVR